MLLQLRPGRKSATGRGAGRMPWRRDGRLGSQLYLYVGSISRRRASHDGSVEQPGDVQGRTAGGITMEDIWLRFTSNLADRVSGPLKFRLLLQPTVAVILAVIAGLKDAKTGKPPYFWALFTEPLHRREMMADGWKSVGKLFIVALCLDIAYQFIVARFVYPGEAIVVALLLAIVPYLMLRGLVTRIARR